VYTAELFRLFDKNSNGKITFKEFSEGIENLRCSFSLPEIRALFDFLD
jgi:Ca2+-binding EF-hand superfamily protein